MTVADLIKALQREPPHLPVYIERFERRAYGGTNHHYHYPYPAQVLAVSLEGPHVLIVPNDNWMIRP